MVKKWPKIGLKLVRPSSKRSEERRVGKDDHCVDLGGRRIIKKKKKKIFFKQKTAYEIADSDWSSDVCSSDLL